MFTDVWNSWVFLQFDFLIHLIMSQHPKWNNTQQNLGWGLTMSLRESPVHNSGICSRVLKVIIWQLHICFYRFEATNARADSSCGFPWHLPRQLVWDKWLPAGLPHQALRYTAWVTTMHAHFLYKAALMRILLKLRKTKWNIHLTLTSE